MAFFGVQRRRGGPGTPENPTGYALDILRRPPRQPQPDTEEVFASLDPVEQNRTLIGRARNARNAGQLPGVGLQGPWADYFDLLKAKGAQLNPRARPAEPGLPAGYTEGQLDQENIDALSGGRTPRYTQSQNLPSSQNRIRASIEALLRGRR